MSLGYSRGSFSCRSAWLGWDTRTARTGALHAGLEQCPAGMALAARRGHSWAGTGHKEGTQPGWHWPQGGDTAGLALVAQVKLSHPMLVTLWLVQLLQGTNFGCSGAQLGPWCSAQLFARVCQEHPCSFKPLAPRFFCFTPATTQAGSGSCWQVRTVTS